MVLCALASRTDIPDVCTVRERSPYTRLCTGPRRQWINVCFQRRLHFITRYSRNEIVDLAQTPDRPSVAVKLVVELIERCRKHHQSAPGAFRRIVTRRRKNIKEMYEESHMFLQKIIERTIIVPASVLNVQEHEYKTTCDNSKNHIAANLRSVRRNAPNVIFSIGMTLQLESDLVLQYFNVYSEMQIGSNNKCEYFSLHI